VYSGSNPPPIVVPGAAVDPSMCAGLTFPLSSGSLQHISVNFGAPRADSTCHTGIDLFTQGSRRVLAMADGVVTAIDAVSNECNCTGTPTKASSVYIYHASIQQTVNYGDMTASNVQVTVGQMVSRGDYIGTAGACCLLHFELLQGEQTSTSTWTPAAGVVPVNPDGCVQRSLSTLPSMVLDPRPLINCIKPATASLLEDSGVGSEYFVQAAASVSTRLGAGYIVLIVIVVLLVLASVGVCVFCFVRQRSRNGDAENIAYANPAYNIAPVEMSNRSNSKPSGGSGTISTPPYATSATPAAKFNTMSNVSTAPYATSSAPYATSAAPVAKFNTMGNMSTPPYATSSAPYAISAAPVAKFNTMGSGGGTMNGFGTMTSPSYARGAAAPTASRAPAAGFAMGQFKCSRCDKVYNYQDDLNTHVALRHQ
jgi:hypothetical protein